MGQKSRSKKNKTKNTASAQVIKNGGSNTREGLTLAGLEQTSSSGSTFSKPNPLNISYEMMGNLHFDIKKLFFLLLVCALLLVSVYVVKLKTPYVNEIGNKVASFLSLS